MQTDQIDTRNLLSKEEKNQLFSICMSTKRKADNGHLI